jgi:insertion element IS1 protein InsB
VALSGKKTQKLWIWKAMDSDTGELLDWECGDRSKRTLKKLVDRLSVWDVQFYCTDEWESYRSLLPAEKLVMSKKVTVGIERNNCRNRHWFKRFCRKTIVVSKSREMVDLTMALFARFRVNGSVYDILSMPSLLVQ